MPREEIAGKKTECPWRYPGQYEDRETGLYYNRFRYYDPESGRYVSQDPIGLRNGVAQYGYVTDPYCWIDPLGLVFRGPARRSTDWGHIFEGHWIGSPVKIRGNNDVFGSLSKKEIMQVVNEAWELRKKIKTQGERIKYEAYVSSRLWVGRIEMWFDKETGVLEAAYPTKSRAGCK